SVYDEQVAMMEMVLPVDEIVEAVKKVREELGEY
nr:glycine/sarcosine/betaine reductase complex selenoprotein A [Deltaproteobacteria bacterium]